MKILLTGASGFLGTHTARELLKRGHHVTALVRSTSKVDLLKKMNLNFVEGSLPQEKSLEKALEGVDVVVHVAGIIKAFSEEDFFEVNAHGTEYLVREILSLALRPKLFLHISTIAVHDPGRDGPDFCLPAPDCHPLSQYGRSKRAGELALEGLRNHVPTLVLRPPVLYGPGDRELLPLFKACRAGWVPVYEKGTNRFSVCYVEDIARAIAVLTEWLPKENEIFCLDSGEIHTWKTITLTLGEILKRSPRLLTLPDFAFSGAAWISQTIAKISGHPEVFTLDKMREIRQNSWVCGHEKLKARTGWKPELRFLEGARRTLRAYEEAGWIKPLPS